MMRLVNLVPWTIIAVLGVPAALPASLWLDVETVQVANARPGESPSMVVRRTIRRPFVADWVVSVRRNGPDGFEVYCTGYGRSDYSPAAAMPKNLNLDWWLGGKPCFLIPGDYFIVTNWQINLPAGFDKTVSAASNVFEVRP